MKIMNFPSSFVETREGIFNLRLDNFHLIPKRFRSNYKMKLYPPQNMDDE